MGLFNFDKKGGKKDKKSSDTAVKKGKAPKKTKHQKKAPLSYTALEPFVDSLYGENGFCANYEGEQLGVVLILPFSEIGGLTLSKEDKRNQSKGTFVTSINKGDFEVYYDEKQDEQEQLVILANTDSVDTLSDFVVTENSEFRWGYFTKDGEVIETDYVSTMDELKENRSDLENYFDSIFDEDEDIDSVKSDDTGADTDDASVTELEDLDELNGLSELTPVDTSGESVVEATLIDEDNDLTDNVGVDSGNVVEEPVAVVNDIVEIEEPNFGQVDPQLEDSPFDTFDNQVGVADDSYGTVYSDSDYDEDLITDGVIVDDEAVNEIVDQVLFRNDLDLVLPIDRFRETYMAGSSDFLIPYYEDDGTWLTQEANRLIHEANDDIHRRVMADGDIAHSTYVRLLNELSIATSNMFDLNGQNDYTERIDNVKDLKAEEENDANLRIQEHLDELEREYEARREAKGNEAKTNAMNTYDNQHRDKHDRRKEEYQRSERKAVETRYKDKIVDIKNERREGAQSYFESGVAKILSKLGEHYVELRKSQKEYANAWGDKLLQFLDDNRSEDIARVTVMQKQLENDDRFIRLQTESDAEIQRLTSSFNSQVDLIKANNEAELQRATNRIQALEEEKAKLAKERELLEVRTSNDYKELSNRYQDVSQELGALRTKANLVELQQSQLLQRDREIEDWKNQVEIVSQANDRNKVAFFCVAVVAVVAALLIGMIAGAQLF